MQKIILDTNVIVSALISNSVPTTILYELVLTSKVQVCLSEAIFSEYLNVLNRAKFARYTDFKTKADVVLNKLRETATFYEISKRFKILKDESDNKFLDLAFASKANFIVTGNTSDFSIQEFKNTSIATPRQFWDDYTSNVIH